MKLNVYFIIISSFFVLLCFQCIAQTENSTMTNVNDPNVVQKIAAQNAVYFPSPPPTDIEGSVYLEEKYINSEFILNEGVLLKGIALRYNILHDAMEFLEKNEVKALYKSKLKQINIGGTIFMVVKMTAGESTKLKYMKSINQNAPLALENYELELKSQYYNPAIHSSRPKRNIIKKISLFANLPNQDVVVPISNKSDLYNLVGSREKEIKEYMKKNKLSVKKIEELQKILEYYISL